MDERKRLVSNQPQPSREERQQQVIDEESHPQASDTAENQSTRNEDENLKFLIIGNSNARDMAGILCNKGSKSSGVVMPGANIDAVAEAAQRMSHTKPDFLVLLALDIDVINKAPIHHIYHSIDNLIHTTREAYKDSHIIISALPFYKDNETNRIKCQVELYIKNCTKPLSTIQCNKTLCRDQLVPILLIGKIRPQRPLVSEYK